MLVGFGAFLGSSLACDLERGSAAQKTDQKADSNACNMHVAYRMQDAACSTTHNVQHIPFLAAQAEAILDKMRDAFGPTACKLVRQIKAPAVSVATSARVEAHSGRGLARIVCARAGLRVCARACSLGVLCCCKPPSHARTHDPVLCVRSALTAALPWPLPPWGHP